MKAAEPGYGALVISLDFELHWGVRDMMPVDGPYRGNLLGARLVVPRLLDLFEEFEIGATWATVGFLFARNRHDLEEYSPRTRPEYLDSKLDAYQEHVGADESEDPLHYAPNLIDEIRRRPRQELGTHTFSHYYCREQGATEETFRDDLRSAVMIAGRSGVQIRSIVFPRNQYAPEYAHVLKEFGITSYRGTERNRMYSGHSVERQRTAWRRGARIVDNYVNLTGTNVTRWCDIPQSNGLCNIPSSRFLRPYSPRLKAMEPLRLRRILTGLGEAARSNGIFHFNWHPHNFGLNIEENICFLRRIFEHYTRLRESHGMRALSMEEVVSALQVAPAHSGMAA